jgi:F like protein
MGRIPQALENKRIKLLALARRRAFESYLRYGRVPALHEQAAAIAVGAEKALGPEADLSVAALPRLKPTAYYTWRTAGYERVRSTHAAHAGQVFSWANAPEGGHPGTAPNCRCWPEPYYGNPSVPDAVLKLAHERQVDTTGTQLWASIDTLTRPDGSLVESAILGRDGTQFRSTFSGSSVAHAVILPSGDKVRLATTGGVQSIYLGDDATPLMQSAWTPQGPRVLRARRDVAFLLRNPIDPVR